MQIREITEEKYRSRWNSLAQHPLQAWEWGEFREKTGVRVVRYGIFDGETLTEALQVTIHRIPYTPWTVGYYPKGGILTPDQTRVLTQIAAKYNCIFIKCEPKVEKSASSDLPSQYREGRTLFTPHNFVLDVTRHEQELLAAMKQKTRYNIRVAEKKGVTVSLDDSPDAFERYLALTAETTERQGFYAHGTSYHRAMWETLHTPTRTLSRQNSSRLTGHLLTATYEGKIITTWVLFRFGDTLYYPYGASTREHREVMANNLVMWKAIQIAKEWGLHYLDMWGALGPEPDRSDPWYGFHTFKAGYGARHVEYIGTWDYIHKPLHYSLYRLAETIRWKILRLLKR